MDNTFYRDDTGAIVLTSECTELPKEATYDGNTTIKRSNIKIQFEEWQIEEIVKCSSDINYFASKYIHIITMDFGKQLIQLRDYQKDLLTFLNENRFPVVLASRQSGKSSTVAIYMLHYILFNSDKKAVILANKELIAREIFSKIRTSYEKLPYWMQVGVKKWQETSCVLENGSGASSAATTADGLRGITANLILLDEFAYCKRNIADEFFTSMMPIVSSGKTGKVVVVSTPSGLNHFYILWKKALANKNNDPDVFNTFRIDYWQVPGRDDEWKEKEIKKIGERRFAQEYGNEFQGSSNTLIESDIIEMMEAQDPIDEKWDYHLKIFEAPKPDHEYAIGADTALGTGGDYSVGNVIDITTFPFKQVAIFRNNKIRPREFGNYLFKLGETYNEAYILIENNDIGHSLITYMHNDLEYENLVHFSYDKKKNKDLGVRSTKKSKLAACLLLKELLETGQLEIRDADTIYEISTFVEVNKNIFRAEEGENDDCVTSLLWAIFILKTGAIDEEDLLEGHVHEEVEEEDEEPDIPLGDGGELNGFFSF